MAHRLDIRLAIFDFNRTLFDPELGKEIAGCTNVLKYIKAKNVHVCIVSRKEGESRKTLIEKQRFSDFADKIYFVEADDKFSTYERAISEFDLLGQETVVIGDYLEKDIGPAIRLGCYTVWFRNGKFASKTPAKTGIYPTYTIEKMIDLIELIK